MLFVDGRLLLVVLARFVGVLRASAVAGAGTGAAIGSGEGEGECRLLLDLSSRDERASASGVSS
jgi:hypothetical protein